MAFVLCRNISLLTGRALARSISATISSEISYSPREGPDIFFFNENFDDEKKSLILNDMKILEDFVSTEEEKSMIDEIEPVVNRLRYENHHWDDAIKGYRETEKLHWRESNLKIIERVKKLAFQPGTEPLKYVHILDLKAEGVIKPHVDSVKFCGNTIAGISLLSDSVMRLRLNEKRSIFVDIYLKRRSLYIMTGTARYDYTHEILHNRNSVFAGSVVLKSRRISVICRNQP